MFVDNLKLLVYNYRNTWEPFICSPCKYIIIYCKQKSRNHVFHKITKLNKTHLGLIVILWVIELLKGLN